ncbi:hypothetical protein DPMN_055429 [Dreissena polymorpha]|uniref:Uncharacterized protein n=2 Tax=Dreissena polymorpha TaxID=45954 RepID=A0A9D4CSD5_DREPO|nr:hypothetical protein DPMN_055429 [Dreissena polymorpha]
MLNMPRHEMSLQMKWLPINCFIQSPRKKIEVQTTQIEILPTIRDMNIAERINDCVMQNVISNQPVPVHHMLKVPRETAFLHVPIPFELMEWVCHSIRICSLEDTKLKTTIDVLEKWEYLNVAITKCSQAVHDILVGSTQNFNMMFVDSVQTSLASTACNKVSDLTGKLTLNIVHSLNEYCFSFNYYSKLHVSHTRTRLADCGLHAYRLLIEHEVDNLLDTITVNADAFCQSNRANIVFEFNCTLHHCNSPLPGCCTLKHCNSPLPECCTLQHCDSPLPGRCTLQHNNRSLPGCYDKTSVNKYVTSNKVKSLRGDSFIVKISNTSQKPFGNGLDHLETIHSEEQHGGLPNRVQDKFQVRDSEDSIETDQDQTIRLTIDHTSRIDDNGPVHNDHNTLDDNNVCCQENKEGFSAKSSSSPLFRENSLNERNKKKKRRKERQKAGTLFDSPLSMHSVCMVYSTDTSFERSVDKNSNKLHKSVKLKSKKLHVIRRHNSDKDIKKGHRNVNYDREHIVKKKTFKMDKTRIKTRCDILQTMTGSGSMRKPMGDNLSKQTFIRRELHSDDSGIMTQTSTDSDSWISWGTILRAYCDETQQQLQQIAKDVAQRFYLDNDNQLHQTVIVNGLRSFFNRVNTGVPLTHEEELQFEWLRFITFHNYEGEGNSIALARNGFYHDHDQGPNATRCFACDIVHEEWTLLDNVEHTHRRLSPNCPLLHNNSGEGTRRNISIAADDGPQRVASTVIENVNVRDASGVSQSPTATSTARPTQSSSVSQATASASIFPHDRSPAIFNPPTPETIRQLDAAAASRRNTSPTSTTSSTLNPVSTLTERIGNAQIRKTQDGTNTIASQPCHDPENMEYEGFGLINLDSRDLSIDGQLIPPHHPPDDVISLAAHRVGLLHMTVGRTRPLTDWPVPNLPTGPD